MKALSVFAKAFYVCSIFFLAAIWASAEPIKPFHIEFIGYQQKPTKDGYLFFFDFLDVPRPHVSVPGQVPWTNQPFQIGDLIGKYKITSFKISVVSPREEQIGPVDQSELTFQNIEKTDEKVQVRFRAMYEMPEARPLDPPTKPK